LRTSQATELDRIVSLKDGLNPTNYVALVGGLMTCSSGGCNVRWGKRRMTLEGKSTPEAFHRSGARLSALLAASGLALGAAGCLDPNTSPTFQSSIIKNENAKLGTPEWLTSNLATQRDLAVWVAPYAVTAGDPLAVFIHAAYGPVRVSIFRMGWYGGLGGRLVWKEDSVAAGLQPPCTAPWPGPVECRWNETVRTNVPPGSTSGVYLVKVTDSRGQSGLYPFVVRSRTPLEFVAVVPQTTWQAYNAFGGSSLYTKGPDGTLGHSVSFERPYALRGGAGYLYGLGYSNDASALMWLEREGYDLTYVSDQDVPALGTTLPLPRKGLIFIGHDEYWTMEQFQATTSLRNRGYHLAFLAGNTAFWRVRLAPGHVTNETSGIVTCYKGVRDPDAPTPADRTTLFRSLGMPENALVGAMYVQHAHGGPYPLVASDSAVGPEAAQFLANAGLDAGDTIPNILDDRTAGWPQPSSLEGDQLVANRKTPPTIQVLFRAVYTGGVVIKSGIFHTTFYVAPSGAGVFDAGLNEWGRFLSGFFAPSNSGIEKVSKSVLDWMSAN
jgi:hypothetical protein